MQNQNLKNFEKGLALESLKTSLRELIFDLEKIVPYASALYKRSSGLAINVNRVQESIEPENPIEGLVFTLWNGQQFFEYSVNTWDWALLKTSLLTWAKNVAQQVDHTQALSQIDPGPKLSQEFESPLSEDPNRLSLKEKLDIAKDNLHIALKADPTVSNAISVVGHVTLEDVYVNRHKVLHQKILRSDMMLVVFLSDGKTSCEIFEGRSKNTGLNHVQLTENQITNLIEDGKKLLHAPRLEPGFYDVIADPDWSGIIAHECFGHGMETDLYVRERALSQHYLGQPIASTIVNMFDDPSLIGEAGGFYFDDEGQLSTPTHIIKNGILLQGLTDMASAHQLNIMRSANGRRESFARKAYARMTNTFFENGAHDPKEMIASVKDGLYLRYATNGMEDPQAWGIQVEGLWAEEIKNGRRTGKIYSPVIMTGFVPELLQSISMVGNDRTISGLGMCGKGHKEWVKNTTGGPHLKMRARLA